MSPFPERTAALAAALLLFLSVSAQPLAGQDPDPPGDRYRVHLVTMSPGPAIWERFAHNGLWVEDAVTGRDLVFQWGLFDFRQENFVTRLIRGEMLYRMGAVSLENTKLQYGGTGRRIWAQELALTPAQESSLVEALYENARPENAEYIYDYYDRNCSTRLRDALDAPGVLSGTLREMLEGVETQYSFRWHTLRLLQDSPWAYYGIHIAFGQPADRPIDRWQETFLPMKLREAVAEATVPDGTGGARPLVVRDTVLVAGEVNRPMSKPSWHLASAGAGAVLGALLIGLGAWGRAAAAGRVLLGMLGVVISAFLGVAGTVMLGLWFFTDHDSAAWNEGVLQATPVHFALAAMLLPLVVGRRPGPRAVRLARWLSALALLGLVLKAVPLFSQANLELVALLLPIQLGLSGALARAALHPRSIDPPPVDRG